MQTPYRFNITSGLVGCYMPNYTAGPYECHTRRELVALVKAELEMLNYPATRLRTMNIARLWRFVQSARSGSSAHTSCDPHNGQALELHGLTEEEYRAQSAEDF